ncbi:MAG: hypothetical protein LBL90_00675 [Prevotellaceae bacterium]|jgi:hypothetical protein|nr:hypothetical protein [Prevotellaceae bacterium]
MKYKTLFFLAIIVAMGKASAQDCAIAAISMEDTLQNILLCDQELRRRYNACNNEQEESLLLAKRIEQDSIHQTIIFPIIDKMLTGEIKELSNNGWRTCFLVLQHASLDAQLKYIDFITGGLKSGHIYNYEYLVFIDRVYTGLNKAQLFGSQVLALPNECYLVLPVCPKAQRDSAFFSIGMDPSLFIVINGSMRYGKPANEYELPEQDNQYNAIEIMPGEFAIIGLILSDKVKKKGVQGVDVKIDDHIMATTDKNGFFAFKVMKNNIPDSLALYYAHTNRIYHLDAAKKKGDFVIIPIY